jgi:4-diphosphocytidyl-2-C-methyl-D-erythritol kinase
MPAVRVFAPAKINLCLHITGQRADGYHLIDTLVGFASVGDVVELSTEGPEGLTISGPEAAGLAADAGNLVSRMAALCWRGGPLRLHLVKNLPVASGIGGGSADAAACCRGIMALQHTPVDPAALLALGADVPMCLASQPARVSGIGEVIAPVALPPLPVLLVNPRVPVPTPAVFRALTAKSNPPLPPLPGPLTAEALTRWLTDQRNDLQAPAVAIAPEIASTLAALSGLPGCVLARMSGSGATCFGIFASDAAVQAAAARLAETRPDWWIAGASLNGPDRAAPQLIRDTT